MNSICIHPDFKLQDKSFKDNTEFLSFVRVSYPNSCLFLKNLLGKSASLSVYTSGSTGKPKHISLSKESMIQSAFATGQFFKLPAKTKALHCLSSNFIAGKMMWVRALVLGWHLEVIETSSHPLKDTNSIYDFAAMVPLQVQNSLAKLTQIKKLIIGGGSLSTSLENKLKKLETSIFQTYGMTETITHIAVKEISKKETNFYTGLPNVTFRIDKRGCLLIDAPRISNNTIQTNDLVKLYTATEFEWLGRIDNLINSGGVKLSPEKIEKELVPFIHKPFMIASLPDKILGEKVILIIESSEQEMDLKSAFFSAKLHKYEIPKRVFYLNNFVYTQNGKIRRSDTISLLDR